MTYGLTPRQKEEVLTLWKTRAYDTVHIAERLSMPEHDVYAVVAARDRKPKPAPVKAPYAAKQRRKERAKSALRPVVIPSKPKPERRCQYRLSDGAQYLHESGEGKTTDILHAWKGDAERAIACCAKYPVAKNMMMELVQ